MSVFVQYCALSSAIGSTPHERMQAMEKGRQRPGKIHIDLIDEPVSVPYQPIAHPPLDKPGRLYALLDEVMHNLLDQSRLSSKQLQKTALFFGSTSYDIGDRIPQIRENRNKLIDGLTPFHTIPDYIRQSNQLGGLCFAYNSACTSSMNALVDARLMLDYGIIEHAIVVGCELYNPVSLSGFYSLQLLAKEVCLPFTDNSGMVLGEAVSAVLLSNYRGDSQLELIQGAAECDTSNISCTQEDGSSIKRVMQKCLTDQAPDIAAIKCHGVGTENADRAELNGIHSVFDEDMPLITLKPLLGNALGAAGVAEFVLLVELFEYEDLPACIYGNDRRAGSIRDKSILLNNFSFGGNNACLLVRHHAD